MLIRALLNPESICKVAMDPLMEILLRPSWDTVRLIRISPSKGISDSARRSARRVFSGKENKASTRASLHPLRIRSDEARPPRMRFTALIMMDLPAPVSPDRILSPDFNVISRSLIMAKSDILRWMSI